MIKSNAEGYSYQVVKDLGFEFEKNGGGAGLFPQNGNFFFNWRPNFLKNKKNLEIDFFLVGKTGKTLAVEVQGDQHRQPAQQQKDALKRDLLREKGITLLEFWPSSYDGDEDAKAALSRMIINELGNDIPDYM